MIAILTLELKLYELMSYFTLFVKIFYAVFLCTSLQNKHL